MRPALAIIQQQPIQSVVVEIRAHLYDAKNAEARRDKLRLQAGQKLIGLRARVEAGEEGQVSWWEWFESQDLGNRKTAEKLMRLAGADDPEAALEAQREVERQASARYRQNGDDVISIPPRARKPEPEYDPVSDAFEIIEQMNDDQLAEFTAQFKRRYL